MYPLRLTWRWRWSIYNLYLFFKFNSSRSWWFACHCLNIRCVNLLEGQSMEIRHVDSPWILKSIRNENLLFLCLLWFKGFRQFSFFSMRAKIIDNLQVRWHEMSLWKPLIYVWKCLLRIPSIFDHKVNRGKGNDLAFYLLGDDNNSLVLAMQAILNSCNNFQKMRDGKTGLVGSSPIPEVVAHNCGIFGVMGMHILGLQIDNECYFVICEKLWLLV